MPAKVSAIPTRGLNGQEGDDVAIGCVHEYVSVGTQLWVARGYGQWGVFFASGVIEEVLRIAASFASGSMLNDYNEPYQAAAWVVVKVKEFA